MLKIRSRRH